MVERERVLGRTGETPTDAARFRLLQVGLVILRLGPALILLFLAFQRLFIESFTQSGLKG